MKREKNAHFLIKVCSVCFSITQHMSDQQHWWAHQTQKCLRLSPPPSCTPPELRFVEEPPPSMSASLIWTLFQTLIYPEKAYWARFPLFSSASSLIFMCFLAFTPGGRPLTPHASSSRAPPGDAAALLKRTSACCRRRSWFSISLFCFFFPAGPQLETNLFPGERSFLWICPFSTFFWVSVCAWQQLLGWAASRRRDAVKNLGCRH